MRDPIDTLTSLDPGDDVDPLPAAEIRRRGDARRRRRIAGMGATAALALATAVVVPSLLDRGAPIAPADPEPSTGWVTTIPDDATLTPAVDGFEDRFTWVTDDTATGVSTLGLCGEAAYPLDAVTDRLAADSQPTGESADAAGRELRLYADDAAAREALQRVRDAVAGCPQEDHDGTTWLNQELVQAGEMGEESTAVGRTFAVDGQATPGLELWTFVRVGNAIAAIHVYSEHGDLETGYALDGDMPPLQAIVDGMCLYSLEGCAEPTPSPTSSVCDGCIGDFPVDRYLPTGAEYTEFDPTSPAQVVTVCQDQVWPVDEYPGYMEGHGVGVIGPEMVEMRWVANFGDGELAGTAMEDVREAVSDCLLTEVDDTEFAVTELDGGTGQDEVTFALVELGAGPNGAVYQLVRVGSAILFSASAGEYTLESAQDAADDLSEQSADLAGEMCVFTEDGC